MYIRICVQIFITLNIKDRMKVSLVLIDQLTVSNAHINAKIALSWFSTHTQLTPPSKDPKKDCKEAKYYDLQKLELNLTEYREFLLISFKNKPLDLLQTSNTWA